MFAYLFLFLWQKKGVSVYLARFLTLLCYNTYSETSMIKETIYVLLADADISLSTVLADYLRLHHFEVDTVHSGAEALELSHSKHYDICIMDITLHKMNGFEVLEQMKKNENALPVIMLSARNSVEDIVRAYRLGCDEYVTKPFTMDILICKIQAIVRRAQGRVVRETSFLLGDKLFDSIKQEIGGEHLSGRESDLLLMLCRQMPELVDKHVILRTLWSADNNFTARSLAVYINHLRKFLIDTGYSIIGVHGKGYKLVRVG